GRLPASWSTRTEGLDLPPYPAAVAALSDLVDEGGTVDPCLHLDGEVALYLPLEGMVGYAPGGRGPNSADFPAEAILDEDGAGVRDVIELGYPEDEVLVVGG